MGDITRHDIEETEHLIRPHVRTTPVLRVSGREVGLDGFPLTLKLEHLQHAGAFKTRGAFANLLLRKPGSAGVAAASGGSHGVAVAYAAHTLGQRATIFVPTICSPAKIARIRGYGAELVVVGERYADALAACQRWIAQSGAMPIHAFDDRETLLGQGTLARELAHQANDLDTLLVPVGGGGLIGGIAAWYASTIRVIGVEPAASPTLHDALAAGQPVDAPTGGIAAEALAPRRVGELMFPIARAHVTRVVLVSEDAIRRAQRTLWEAFRLVTEPAGAVPVAALLSGAYMPGAAERVGVVISGGNTTAVDFDARP
ncbi:MAG TPA: threonine/serine dehydratase [Methylomirabilota bacterium]|jgi:threonine dehydratase